MKPQAEKTNLPRTAIFSGFFVLLWVAHGRAAVTGVESDSLRVQVNVETGRWTLLDKRSNVQWPSDGMASLGGAVAFSLVDGGRAVELRFENAGDQTLHALADVLTITDAEDGYVIVPSREGLLIPVNNDKAFSREFGTSEYEGCHMNMLGFVKQGSALIVTWDDAYVFPNVQRTVSANQHKLTTTFALRRSARSIRLMPVGKGDWNTIAAEYRRYAEEHGYAVTLRDKIKRDPHVERMVGASNAKLWTCLNRKMNEESTAVESTRVHWTFDEAAQIAEHLRKDLGIERCFFMMGGWTEGGYDVRHPDDLPANPECGGNERLAGAVKRIQALNYVGCLHDNVQDMYRDAKSWSPSFIEKKPDGSLIQGGRWNGGRAYMVCAPKQLELSQRTQNLPAIHDLFSPWAYFIDTTYAVGPRECHDPNHPIGRNDDIAWKIRLSDYGRNIFGIFGSECGREWALPHSDFFEGLVGVSGHYYANAKLPEEVGAQVIPFFEMVYHDCQVCFGKYGYRADEAAEYVAHHVLCARTLHYHSFPDHLYWQSMPGRKADPSAERACYTRSDNGWAEGLHPYDVFIKNTHEVLGAINEVTGYNRLTEFRYLSDDRAVRQAVYGSGDEATRVTVNFASTPAEVTAQTGGRTVLPPWGFLAENPRLIAFYATHWNGQDYAGGALFTLRPTDGKSLKDSAGIRIFHAFGPPTIVWQGKTHEVKREETIKPVAP